MTAQQCMFPGCELEAATRGLCRNHYSGAQGLVKGGHTTWAVLEAAGKAAPAGARGARTKFSGSVQQHFLTEEELAAARASVQTDPVEG